MGLTKPRAAQIYNLDYKQATRVVTVTNIILAGSAPALVDGVSLAQNDRVLVTGQTTATQNGLYDVVTVGTGSNGTWARTNDANSTGEIEAGMIVMVTEGSVYHDTQWKLITDDPIIIGSTTLTFTQNYSANSISGGTSNVTVYSNANVTISSAGTANVLSVSNTGAYVTGVASATGNITGDYFLGNGSQLTGVTATSIGVLPSLSVTGNTISGNISVLGQLSTSLVGSNLVPTANITYSLGNATNRWKDLWLSNSTLYIGNVVLSATNTSLTVNGTEVLTGNAGAAFSTAGNITGGNLLTTGLISATGNVTGSYIIGNGSQLTGLPASYSNADVNSHLAAFGSNTISTTGNITADYFIGNGLALTSITGANITGTVANATYATSSGSAATATNASHATVSDSANSVTGGNIVGSVAQANYANTANSVSGSNVSGTVALAAQSNYANIANSITGSNVLGTVANATQADYANVANSVAGANVTGTVALATHAAIADSANAVAGGNVLGQVANALIAGTVYTNAQPNITSVGTLTSVSVTGNIAGGNVNTGGNVAGNWLLPTTGVSTGGNVLVGGYISVVGNLYVSNVVSNGNLTVTDPLVYFINTQTYPYNYDIGFYSAFTGGTGNTYQHTGLVRDYIDNTWKLFSNVPEPAGTTLDFTNAIYDPLKIGALTATTGAFSSTLSATGNITGNYILGNGSTLTSITGANVIGTVANATYAVNAGAATTATTVTTNAQPNITSVGTLSSISVTGNANSGNVLTAGLVSATGNVTGNYIIGNGSQLTGLPASYSNSNVSSFLAVFGSNTISTSGTITASNITGGNLLTSGLISATGNVAGNYLLGNVAFATGIPATYSNSNVATFLAAFGSNTISTSGTINAGNITGGNVLTGGIVSATGNVTGGNISATNHTGTNVSVTGTVTAASTVGGVITGTSASVSGSVTAASTVGGNITGTLVSVTGNITGSYLFGNGSQLTGIASGGSPGGANTYIQFNDGSVFGGTAGFTFNKTTNAVSTTGSITAASTVGGVITGSSVSVTGAVTGASIVGTITTASQTNITAVGTLSALSVSGNVTAGGHVGTMYTNSIVNTGANSTGNIGSSTGYFNTVFAKATSAQYADLAEMYCADFNYLPGTVVEFGGTEEVTQTTQSHSVKVAGIVSTNPSYLMNSTLNCTNALEIALVGRVPCRVVGTIRKGDRLVSSSIPGVATALDKNLYEPGCIVGKALEDYNSIAAGVIEVAVGRI